MTALDSTDDSAGPDGSRFGRLLRGGGIIRQFISYFAVALLGLVVDFGLLVILTSGFGLNYLLSATIGFSAGLVVTYVLSEFFVFSNPKIASRALRFLIFAAIGVVGLGLVNLLMWLFTDVVGLFYVASKIIATAVVYIWNFFARRAMYGREEPAAQAEA